MIRFRLLNENPVFDYREACKITQGIELDGGEYIHSGSVKWWVRQIVANHSTIRSVRFRMVAQAPRSVIMQIIRATKGHTQPYVQSSRPDWTGKERSNNPYEDKLFIQDHTAESFVEMAKQRLCMRTEERTRKFMEEAVRTLSESDVPFLKAVGLSCHPVCWWYESCPELKSCGRVNRRLSDKFNVE